MTVIRRGMKKFVIKQEIHSKCMQLRNFNIFRIFRDSIFAPNKVLDVENRKSPKYLPWFELDSDSRRDLF